MNALAHWRSLTVNHKPLVDVAFRFEIFWELCCRDFHRFLHNNFFDDSSDLSSYSWNLNFLICNSAVSKSNFLPLSIEKKEIKIRKSEDYICLPKFPICHLSKRIMLGVSVGQNSCFGFVQRIGEELIRVCLSSFVNRLLNHPQAEFFPISMFG